MTKDIKKSIKLSPEYLETNAKGRPYVVLSLDNNLQRGTKANEFRKVYPIVPKIRSASQMFEEYVEYMTSTKVGSFENESESTKN